MLAWILIGWSKLIVYGTDKSMFEVFMLLIIYSPLHKCLMFLSVYVCVRAHGRVSVWPKDFDYNQICVSKGQQMEKQ